MDELHIDNGLPYLIIDYKSIIEAMPDMSESERRQATSQCRELITSFYNMVSTPIITESEDGTVFVDISTLEMDPNQYLGATDSDLAIYNPNETCFYIYDRNAHVWDSSPLSHHVSQAHLDYIRRKMTASTVFDIKSNVTRIVIDFRVYIFELIISNDDIGTDDNSVSITTTIFNLFPSTVYQCVDDVVVVLDNDMSDLNLVFSREANYIIISAHTFTTRPHAVTLIPPSFSIVDANIYDSFLIAVLIKHDETGRLIYGTIPHGAFAYRCPNSVWRLIDADYDYYALSGPFILACRSSDFSDYEWIVPNLVGGTHDLRTLIGLV